MSQIRYLSGASLFTLIYNPRNNDWDNRLKINPEIKFPSEKSKFTSPTMLMIICTNPSLLLIFSSQHWTGGEGGDVYLGNLVNCDDHVLLYTSVPMNFAQDCRSFKHWMVRCDLSLVEIKFLLV